MGCWCKLIMSKEVDEDDFVILIATDNHLGYLEKDPIRRNDSIGK